MSLFHYTNYSVLLLYIKRINRKTKTLDQFTDNKFYFRFVRENSKRIGLDLIPLNSNKVRPITGKFEKILENQGENHGIKFINFN